ncbi:MAG: cyclic pyranopterin monophosphate synthase MoaC [Chloroflexi bacterium]|nr:cyclic pyranopterin monophosphate synthase MoaC [Chloroflexota bacterium]
MSSDLSHLDSVGNARMVDVGDKPSTARTAIAEGRVTMKPSTLDLIRAGSLKKGDVIATARIAGVMAAKRTSELIPLCHPIALSKIDVDIQLSSDADPYVHITAEARTVGQTGVEMEALTAVSVAALTIYDMAKAVDREMRIEGIRLLSKTGGIHGDYRANDAEMRR